MVERMSDMSDEAFGEPLVKSQAPEGGLGIKDPDSAFTLLASNSTPNSTPNTTPETPTPSLFKRFQTPIRALLAGVTLFGAQTISSGALPGNAKEGVKNPQGQSEEAKGGISPSQQAIEQRTRETLASSEKRETEYSSVDFKATNTGVIGIVTLRDGTRRLVETGLDSKGKLALKNLTSTSFFATSTAEGKNPNIKVIVGSDVQRGNKGKIMYMTDGKNWNTKDYGNGALFQVQVDTNDSVAVISAANQTNNNEIVQVLLNLNSGNLQDLKINQTDGGYGMTGMTQPSGPTETFSWRAILNLVPGYFRFVKTANSIQSTLLNTNEGYLWGKPVEYKDSGKTIIWTFNNDENTPENPDGRTGSLYVNVDDIKTTKIHPTVAFYTTQGSINIWDAAINLTDGLGYMLNSTQPLNIHRPYIEIFDPRDLNNLSKRMLLPKDGDWPETGLPKTIHYVETGGEKVLFAVIESGVYYRRVTNGINSTDQWVKLDVVINYYAIELPVITKTAAY